MVIDNFFVRNFEIVKVIKIIVRNVKLELKYK